MSDSKEKSITSKASAAMGGDKNKSRSITDQISDFIGDMTAAVKGDDSESVTEKVSNAICGKSNKEASKLDKPKDAMSE